MLREGRQSVSGCSHEWNVLQILQLENVVHGADEISRVCRRICPAALSATPPEADLGDLGPMVIAFVVEHR